MTAGAVAGLAVEWFYSEERAGPEPHVNPAAQECTRSGRSVHFRSTGSADLASLPSARRQLHFGSMGKRIERPSTNAHWRGWPGCPGGSHCLTAPLRRWFSTTSQCCRNPSATIRVRSFGGKSGPSRSVHSASWNRLAKVRIPTIKVNSTISDSDKCKRTALNARLSRRAVLPATAVTQSSTATSRLEKSPLPA